MRIYGYLFAVVVNEGESGFVAYAPGVGGIYEEGATREEAIRNAYEAACAIIETRVEKGDLITENSPYIKVLTSPPNQQYIDSIKDISNGYIVTPRCLEPALA